MHTEEFANVLRRLAGHISYLQQELEDSGLPVARQSQTGVRSSTVNRSAPVDLTQLDYMQAAAVIVKGWSFNLAKDTCARGLPMNQPLAHWAAWLRRNVNFLADVPWLEDCEVEIVELESDLRHRIHPTDPHEIKLPDYASAEEIGQAIGKKANTIRTWCRRNNVTAYVESGITKYRTAEIKH